MSGSTTEYFKCEHCDYKSTRQYNVKRHMVSKHTAEKHTLPAEKHTLPAEKHTFLAEKHTLPAEKHTLEDSKSTHTIQCETCQKIFSSHYNLKVHAKTCKGKNYTPETCQFCDKCFHHASAKYRHVKICKVKKDIDAKALTVITQPVEEPTAQPCETNSTVSTINNNINTNTANITTTTNNTNSNNVTNIIVYNSERMEFMNDHISHEKLLSWLNSHDHAATMKSYSREIMGRKENQFVKKTNLRSSTSEVHLGNDNWEMRLDRELYPEIVCNIANGFGELISGKVHSHKRYHHILTDHARKRMYKSLDAFIDYMATNGYCNDSDEDKVKHINYCFNTLVKDLKVITFNYTRSAISKQLHVAS